MPSLGQLFYRADRGTCRHQDTYLTFAMVVAVVLTVAGSDTAVAGPPRPPFTSARVEVVATNFPPLHSYVMGESGDDLLFFGGISGMGFHSLQTGGRITFPYDTFSRLIHLYDPVSGTTLSGDIDHLPASIQDSLVVTNAAGIQFGNTLYIHGGMSPVGENVDWVTRATVSAVNLPAVRAAIRAGTPIPASAFTVTAAPESQVAGMQLQRLSGTRYALVGGAEFHGNYGSGGSGSFATTYSLQIHIFDAAVSHATPVESYSNAQFRRRDLVVSPVTLGEPGQWRLGFIVHGSPFTGSAFPGLWPHALVYDPAGPTITLDNQFQQMMNQYETTHASFYSATRSENYFILMGGLSGANWDGSSFVSNAALPWVTDVTSLTFRGAGMVSENVIGQTVKPVVDAELVLDASIPHNDADQIAWDDLPPGEILLGRFYGGIEAAAPGNVSTTVASSNIYAVYITVGKIKLDSTDLVAGQDATLSVTNAIAGERVYFAYSLRGDGPTFVPLLNLSLNLSRPIAVAGSTLADANGNADLVVHIPPSAPPVDVWMQAVMNPPAGAEKSNLVVKTIQH